MLSENLSSTEKIRVFRLLPVWPEVKTTDGKSIFMLSETYVTQKLVKNGKNTRFPTTSGLAGSDDGGCFLMAQID